MKYIKYFISILLVALLCGCNKETLNYIYDSEANSYEIENTVYVETEEITNLVKIDVEGYGIIIAELYPEIAPITVENFQKLVSEGFYDGLIFHRVVKNFVIQTGDPTATGTGGSADTIKGEFANNGVTNDISHTKGVLSMARRGGNPDTEEFMNSASSQFFITSADATELDGNYAAFGKVINGLDVVEKVSNVTVNAADDKPVINQTINSIKFVNLFETTTNELIEEGE